MSSATGAAGGRSLEIGHDILGRPGRACEAPSGLDLWLTGRWRAYSTIAPAWDRREAASGNMEQTLLGAAGLSPSIQAEVDDPLAR